MSDYDYEQDLVSLRSGLANALAIDHLPTDAELIERVEELAEAAAQGPITEEGWKRHIERLRARQTASYDLHQRQVRNAIDAHIRWKTGQRRNEELAFTEQPDAKTVTRREDMNREAFDVPTAWYLQRSLHIAHEPRCSSTSGVLCDCGAVQAWWEINVRAISTSAEPGDGGLDA